MNIQVQDSDGLARAMAQANADRSPVASIDLRSLNRILKYSPEDMTVTVQSAMNLIDLQSHLADAGQWLPLDPPFAENWTMRGLIDDNPSGPRRCASGTLRDYVIGMELVRANGDLIKSGGQVVKNVAGLDLCKLFIGAHGSLGVMTSVTFKLLPLPEKEVICCRRIPNVEKLTSALKQLQVMHRGALPAIMDVYRAEGQSGLGTLIVGFSGNRQSVEESSAAAIGAGLSFEMYNTWERHAAKPGLPELGYNRQFWADRSWREGTIESVRRSRLPALIERLPIGTPFVARLGQGTLYHSGHRMTESSARPRSLEMRMKQQFDPHGILPDLP